MLATVTNRARGARGFQSLDRGTVMIEPGDSATLRLADHALHRAWEEAGDVEIVFAGDETGQSQPAEAGRLPERKTLPLSRSRK